MATNPPTEPLDPTTGFRASGALAAEHNALLATVAQRAFAKWLASLAVTPTPSARMAQLVAGLVEVVDQAPVAARNIYAAGFVAGYRLGDQTLEDFEQLINPPAPTEEPNEDLLGE